jgi:hypothetical protein
MLIVRSLLKAICILLLLLFSHACLLAQGPLNVLSNHAIGVDFEMGASMPANKSTRDVYFFGLNASAGVKITALKSQKLWIKPLGGIKWYYKEIEKENSITDHFRVLKAGLEFQYSIPAGGDFTFYPLLRFDHNWCANYFSATYSTGIGSNYSRVEKSEKFLTGTGFSADAGIRMQHNRWYLKLDYGLFKPQLHVSQQLIDEAYGEGYIIAPTRQFNFNSFNLSFGSDLIFTK